MFWSKNKKNVYPCKPQFYYIKVGCKGVFVTRTCFRDVTLYIECTFNQLCEGMHLNISNEFNFSEVHGSMNCSGSLAKFICHFARDPLRFILLNFFDPAD